MKKVKIFLSLFFLSVSIYSQVNLVPNGGFETASPCPNYPGQINRAVGWNNVNLVYNNFTVGTPDYFHACGTSSAGYSAQPPATFAGTCNPHLGGGFVATVLYNTPYPDYREYFSTQLSCPMVAGNTYTVSWWLTNGTGPKSPFTIKNIGAHFSTAPLTQAGWSLISVIPQCEITGYSGSNAWVQYSFTITATANWQYITLGSFRSDALNGPVSSYVVPFGPSQVYANYFWDDVSVIGTGGGNIPSTVSAQNVSCSSGNNGSATITPTSPGTYTYNWQPGNQSTQSISNLTAGIYTVTISSGCSSSTYTVAVTQQPSPTITVNSVTTCANSFINITANTIGGTPAYTYAWSQGASTSSVVNVNATNSIISCTVTDSQGCKASGSAPIVISPTTSNFLISINACKGVITTTNNSTGATQYLWDFGNGTTSTLASPSYTYSTPGNYNVSLVASNSSGCRDSIAQTITISNPTQSIFSLANSVCDYTVSFNNTSVGATTYQWDFGDGNTSSVSSPGPHLYSGPGTYTVSLITNPGSPCADTLKQTVTIGGANTISQFSSFSSPCTLSVSTINTSSLASSYLWNFGDGFTSTLTNPNHSYSSIGVYTISLVANPGTSCADTSYHTVNINGNPIASFNYIKDPCSPNITFTNNSLNSNSCEWIFGGANTSNLNNPTFNFIKPGTYTVGLIAQPGFGCADTIIQTIVVSYFSVTADFNYQNPQYTNDIQLTNLSQNAVNYEWSFGDGFGSTVYEPFHEYDQMGDYTVCLKATNFIGCTDIICKNIKVDSDWTLYVPDVFTPNQDGLNDIFYAYGTNIKKYKLMIFDRWGEKIFTSEDMHLGWDGKYKGKPVQEDVYVWLIDFVDVFSKSHEKTGHVTVIK